MQGIGVGDKYSGYCDDMIHALLKSAYETLGADLAVSWCPSCGLELCRPDYLAIALTETFADPG